MAKAIQSALAYRHRRANANEGICLRRDAKKSFEKLVAEKRKKGYVDSSTTEGSTPPNTTSTAKARPSKATATKPNSTENIDSTEAAATPESSKDSQPIKTSKRITAATVATDVVRSIDLSPKDWFRAKFRATPKLERDEPRPFDKAACVQALSKLKTTSYGWVVKWEDLQLPAVISKAEAHFWLLAMTKERDRDAKMPAFAESIEKLKATGEIKPADVWSLIANATRADETRLMHLITNLFSPLEIVEGLLSDRSSKGKQRWQQAVSTTALVAGFDEYVRPYLGDSELKTLQKVVANKLDPSALPDSYESFPMAHYLAASLGMHQELYKVTSSWDDDYYVKNQYAAHYQQPKPWSAD